MEKHTSKCGFTLIELLVVIAIISLLTSIALTQLQTARQRAKDAKRRIDLVQLRTALEEYYNDNGHYPATPPYSTYNHGWLDSTPLHNPNDYIPGLVPKYISKLPQEPDVDQTYCKADSPPQVGDYQGTSYRYLSDGVSYKVHDHCAPISPSMTNVEDPFFYCPGHINDNPPPHKDSWAVYGGSINANSWCGSTMNDNGDNLGVN